MPKSRFKGLTLNIYFTSTEERDKMFEGLDRISKETYRSRNALMKLMIQKGIEDYDEDKD